MRALLVRLTEFDEENLKDIRELHPLLATDTATIRAALERFAQQARSAANAAARRRIQKAKTEATK